MPSTGLPGGPCSKCNARIEAHRMTVDAGFPLAITMIGKMKTAWLALLGWECLLLLWPLVPAQGQGVLLVPGRQGSRALGGLVLRDPKTGDCLAPEGREWDLQVRGGPKGTQSEDWCLLQPPF
jgi:hypothetical protein